MARRSLRRLFRYQTMRHILSAIRDLADAIIIKKIDPLPEWKLAQYNGNPLQWHERKSAINSESLNDDVQLVSTLVNFETVVTGKAKTAKADFAYCGLLYKHALRTLEGKIGQPQAVIGAHFDKLSNFPPLKKYNSNKIVGIFYSNIQPCRCLQVTLL